jgi:sacsin
LLILDPHEEWSPGGNVYDFVATSSEVAMQNHMAAFQTVINDVGEELQATAIRVPLRTPDQAAKSDISNRVTTVSEVSEILRSFASELGDSGLLFMRSIEKIQIRATGVSIDIEMVDGKALCS